MNVTFDYYRAIAKVINMKLALSILSLFLITSQVSVAQNAVTPPKKVNPPNGMAGAPTGSYCIEVDDDKGTCEKAYQTNTHTVYELEDNNWEVDEDDTAKYQSQHNHHNH